MSQITKPWKHHEFNWAAACRECSVDHEFDKLRDAIEDAIEEVQEDPPLEAESYAYTFHFKEAEPGEMFSASRHMAGRPVRTACFIKGKKDIAVEAGVQQTTLTMAMNHSGECRYKINGEGKYLRWQVVREMIGELLMLDQGEGGTR